MYVCNIYIASIYVCNTCIYTFFEKLPTFCGSCYPVRIYGIPVCHKRITYYVNED